MLIVYHDALLMYADLAPHFEAVPVLASVDRGGRQTFVAGVARAAGVAGLRSVLDHLADRPETVAATADYCASGLGVTSDAVALAWNTDGAMWLLHGSLAPFEPPTLPCALHHGGTPMLAADVSMQDLEEAGLHAMMRKVEFPPAVRRTLQAATARWDRLRI